MHLHITADATRLAEADARFKREYADQRQHFQRTGLSEDDYLASRRVDEGLATLGYGSPDEPDDANQD